MKNKKPRKIITRVPTLSLLTLALLAGSVQAEDIGERTDQGISMLASLQSEQGLVYLNASIWLDEQQATRGLTSGQLHERVLVKGERVFIDFSALTDKDERQQAKKAMKADRYFVRYRLGAGLRLQGGADVYPAGGRR
jgi:hemolysin